MLLGSSMMLPVRPAPITRRTPLATLARMAADLAADQGWWREMLPVQPDERSAMRMFATDEHEAWLVVWPPGSSVSPHDHGDAHGVLRVLTGELLDIRWSATAAPRRRLIAGQTARLPVGLVHDVVAPGSLPAASVHLYSPPLRQMGFYDEGGAERTHISSVGPPVPGGSDRGFQPVPRPARGTPTTFGEL